jgi:hypothetical protein
MFTQLASLGFKGIKSFLVMALVLGATLVVAVGRGLITASLAASTYKYIGWGTGAGTAGDSDTTLFTEVTDTARATGTQSQQTTTTTSDTYRVVGTITATTGRAITNAGVFDAVSTGNMFSKGDFTVINLTTGDSIQFTFNHKLS